MRLLKWLFALALILALLIVTAPIAFKYYAVHWLQERGYEASLTTISINPFNAKLTIAGLKVVAPTGKGFRADLLEAHLKVAALRDKALVIRKLKAQGLRFELGELTADVDALLHPVEQFISQHMSTWRFEVRNSLAEHVEICRAGRVPDGRQLSQCFSIGSATFLDSSVVNSDTGWQFESSSSISFQRMYFKDDLDGSSLMYLGSAVLRNVSASKNERRVGQMLFESFHLVEREADETDSLNMPYQTQLDSLVINDIVETRTPSETLLRLGLVDFTALRQTLHKDRDAAFVVVSRLRDIFPFLDDAIGQKRSFDKPPVTIEVMKTRIVDGGISWLDDSVSPPAQEALIGLSLELGPFNTANVDRRTPLLFDAKLGEVGDIALQGDVALFAKVPNFQVEGNIRGLDLAKVSAYTEILFAEKATQGRLDTSFQLEAASGSLEGDAAVRLGQLKTLGGANRDGTMSLQNAYNRLRGASGEVDVNVLFNFNLDSATSLAEAMGGQVKRTLSDRAKGRPPAKRKAPVQRDVLAFESLKYNPRATEFTGAQATRLREVARAAKDNAGRKLVVCPITTGGEWSALFRQGRATSNWEQIPSSERDFLLDLARKRGNILSRELQNLGVPASRIEVCEPRLELSESGPSFASAELQ